MVQIMPWRPLLCAQVGPLHKNFLLGQQYFCQPCIQRNLLCKNFPQGFCMVSPSAFSKNWQSTENHTSQSYNVYQRVRKSKFVNAAYGPGLGLPQSSRYNRLEGCLIIPPAPSGTKPRGIVKFLGGAFIGAVPEVFYSLFIDLLAREGFLVVAVPYNVTFDHAQATKEVHDKFNKCMDTLLASGLPSANLQPSDIEGLPVYCIGHSNGALLQSLKGCYFEEKLPMANVLIAFNNKPAADAVPYFEQVGPAASQLAPVFAASPFMDIATNTSGDTLKAMMDAVGPMLQQYDPDVIASLARFSEQLPLVMNQITEGTSEFKPSPSENKETIQTSYKVPNTLLVKFTFDTIDETDKLEETLKPRVEALGGSLSKLVLNGTHVTPCGQDLRWAVGDVYTPADAVAQGFKGAALNDIRTLVKTVVQWLDQTR
eukprot:TRINITY_DN5996_c0_g1_i1.p1 TRINITY_DN5996_c0_g1~~TRINITY_DN5996_c0_g1_i1.p1  ORF type:complete len:427 (+),score=90.71 TRINITY_DN5996_c0_g1_i1:385-1665(+)